VKLKEVCHWTQIFQSTIFQNGLTKKEGKYKEQKNKKHHEE
jgi:hypothetical protein